MMDEQGLAVQVFDELTEGHAVRIARPIVLMVVAKDAFMWSTESRAFSGESS
jgi:hypothetical protein